MVVCGEQNIVNGPNGDIYGNVQVESEEIILSPTSF